MPDTNTVETKDEAAVTSQESVVTQTTTSVDYEALLKQKDEEIAKVQEEKNNYRKGLLKAKGKLPEDHQSDTDETEDIDAKIDRKVNERLLTTKEAQLTAEKDAAIAALVKRNKEYELALKNRGQITSTSDGSNQEKPEGKKDNYFSNEQIAALRAKGYDDKKIETLKKNMAKIDQMPR